MTETESPEQHFVTALENLVRADNRAALAALRRGLGKPPGTTPEMYPYVVPLAPERGDDPYYLVAALFAWHPDPWHAPGRTSNLGASMARVARDSGSESIERRFVAMLNAPSEDLPEHLRHAVGLCRAHEVPVNWLQLLRDLQWWDASGSGYRRVQRSWAGSFWNAAPAEAAVTEAPTDTSATAV
jgi:CRISPR system Cascade subunit CasB